MSELTEVINTSCQTELRKKIMDIKNNPLLSEHDKKCEINKIY